MKFVTATAAATQKLAAKIAKEILKSGLHRKHARIIALVGDLGAGKTTFTQGFAKALGIKHRMVSPTFLIFRRYVLRDSQFANFYHADAYRIHSSKELKVLGFKEILKNQANIVLIEWADKIKKILPKDAIWIQFRHGRKQTERQISLNNS